MPTESNNPAPGNQRGTLVKMEPATLDRILAATRWVEKFKASAPTDHQALPLSGPIAVICKPTSGTKDQNGFYPGKFILPNISSPSSLGKPYAPTTSQWAEAEECLLLMMNEHEPVKKDSRYRGFMFQFINGFSVVLIGSGDNTEQAVTITGASGSETDRLYQAVRRIRKGRRANWGFAESCLLEGMNNEQLIVGRTYGAWLTGEQFNNLDIYTTYCCSGEDESSGGSGGATDCGGLIIPNTLCLTIIAPDCWFDGMSTFLSYMMTTSTHCIWSGGIQLVPDDPSVDGPGLFAEFTYHVPLSSPGNPYIAVSSGGGLPGSASCSLGNYTFVGGTSTGSEGTYEATGGSANVVGLGGPYCVSPCSSEQWSWAVSADLTSCGIGSGGMGTPVPNECCPEDPLPRTLYAHVTVTPGVDPCPNSLNGFTVDIAWYPIGSDDYWSGEVTNGGFTSHFSLSCINGNFAVQVLSGEGCYNMLPTGSGLLICSPFSFTQSFETGSGDNCCESAEITITISDTP
jgi:hypothetical protein